jgi:hypothetical protein
MRRRANVQAGLEMVLMGLSLPLLYLAATVMFFHDFTTTGMVLVAAGSLLLIGLGFAAVWRSRHP